MGAEAFVDGWLIRSPRRGLSSSECNRLHLFNWLPAPKIKNNIIQNIYPMHPLATFALLRLAGEAAVAEAVEVEHAAQRQLEAPRVAASRRAEPPARTGAEFDEVAELGHALACLDLAVARAEGAGHAEGPGAHQAEGVTTRDEQACDGPEDDPEEEEDEQEERQKQEQIEKKKKEPMPAYVVPSDP